MYHFQKSTRSTFGFASVAILMFSFIFIACEQSDVAPSADELSVTQEIESLSIFGLATQTQQLSLDPSISVEKRQQLADFAERIFLDLNNVKNMKLAARRSSTCIPPGYCYDDYIQCIDWAVHWDNLLAQCNGPTPPSNCEQVRADYLANLDEIEATYHNCSIALYYCQDLYCPSGPGGGL